MPNYSSIQSARWDAIRTDSAFADLSPPIVINDYVVSSTGDLNPNSVKVTKVGRQGYSCEGAAVRQLLAVARSFGAVRALRSWNPAP